MKILLYYWNAYSNYFLQIQLEKLGYTVIPWKDEGLILDEEEALKRLSEELENGYQAVFSFNYFKAVAIACGNQKVPYVSWIQDSPLLSLYDNTAYLETNYFFCFDYEQYEGMKARGVSHAYYYPLGVDMKALCEIADCGQGKEEYGADVSFVGSLYSERNMFSVLDSLPAFLKGYIEAICQAQLRVPGIRFSQVRVPENILNPLKKILVFHGMDETKLTYEVLVENLIDRNVTAIERNQMIQRLSEEFDFRLYTKADTSRYPKVKNCGTVDYYMEMPKVFRQSKININISLRSIRCGIPLRILDIIASGGFVLTNYQEDLYRYFEEGKSIATFYNLDDMIEKIHYYLEHEEERKSIIEEGMKVVKREMDFSVLLPRILELAGISQNP